MNKKILAVVLAVFALFGSAVFALLATYASVGGTATVQQSVVSADNGTTLTAVWAGDNTTTTLNGGETGRIFFDVDNRNREHAINVSISGSMTTPDSDGNDIESVSLNGVECTYTPADLTFTCASQEQLTATASDWTLDFVTADAAPAGTYTSQLNIAPV